MSSSGFGAPDAADILMSIGDVYLSRGALAEGLRLYLSGVPIDVAVATLQSLAIELASRRE